jgi:hypothetical protein
MSLLSLISIQSISIIFQAPSIGSKEYAQWRFYSSSVTPEELLNALSTPEILEILKKAVYSVHRKQRKTYGAEYYSREGLVTEVLFLVIDRIIDRSGLRLPDVNVRLDYWFYRVFENATKDVLRQINREGTRLQQTTHSHDQDDKKVAYLEEKVFTSEETAYGAMYQAELDSVLSFLLPETILCKGNKISPNRILVFLMLYAPEKVTLSDFSEATNYNRSLHDVWNQWTKDLPEYLIVNATDTASKKYSRAYLCFLLRGAGFSSLKQFKKKASKAFHTARDTFAKTVQRAEEDTFRVMVVRASQLDQVDDELFELMAKIAGPHIAVGSVVSFVRELCAHRHNNNMLARLLFSTKKTLQACLEDESKSCQARFQFYIEHLQK